MDKKFIISLQGKDFVKFEGLLNEFHKNGGKEIFTEILNYDPFIVRATVKGEKGTYTGIGDADETNVNKMIVKHKYRMAETRAIARALRWYNNIGMCSADELGGGDVKPSREYVSSGKISIKQIEFVNRLMTSNEELNTIGNEYLKAVNKEFVKDLNGAETSTLIAQLKSKF